MKLDVTLKWIATAILIVGTGLNSMGFYPVGPLLLLAGGVVWLVVSIMWREPALIITNLFMTLVAVAGLLYTYLA